MLADSECSIEEPARIVHVILCMIRYSWKPLQCGNISQKKNPAEAKKKDAVFKNLKRFPFHVAIAMCNEIGLSENE